MSYWIYMEDKDGNICKVKNHTEGGTHVIEGTDKAELNITYNYSPFFYEHLDRREGLRWLCDKSGKECVGRLEQAIGFLGIERDDNYWKATPGNAGYALSVLLKWAKENPDAIFRG